MADAIEYLGDASMKETVRFVKMFDRFFDMLNLDHWMKLNTKENLIWHLICHQRTQD